MSGTRRRPGRLGPFVVGYRVWLLEAGYTPQTVRLMLKDLGRLGRWMDAEGIEIGAVTVASIESCLAEWRAAGARRVPTFRALRSMLPPVEVPMYVAALGPRNLELTGALADGWLGSFVTPAEARAGREAIERAAADIGRRIEPDHFGISLALEESTDGELSPELAAAARRRRPELDPSELIAADWNDLHRKLDAYLDAGLTKFVIRPAGGTPLNEFLDRFVTELLGGQN